ncbi:hypothetical protein LCGC14_0408620 [marine sediment metagenome]|uniref:Large polyvalent protein associated domain-containing protein n=1 Tax=marine sediment metagenome TaxID=412755 RepID=A0A0F9SUG4_9ZZZZ
MVEPIVKEPDKPRVVPPVEIPEFFPGFGKELQQLGVGQFRAQKRLAEAERKKKQVEQLRIKHPLSELFGFRPPEGFVAPTVGGIISEKNLEQAILEAQQEYDLAIQNLKSTIWRQEVMVTLPNYLSIPDYKVQTAEDVLKYVPLDNVRDEDMIWLTAAFDRLKHLSNVLPEGFDGDAIEAQTKILDEILTAPKLELRAVANLTVDEIAKSFAFGVAELPQGMTEEQVRSMLSQMDLEDEEMKSAKDWLNARATNWRLETTRLNLIREGIVLAEAPELTPFEFGKLLLTQPMMATVYGLDKYFNMLPRPLASAAIIGVHKLFNTPEYTAAARLEGQYDYFRSMGLSNWESYATAFNEWDAPWWYKLGAEVFFDPVSYIGLGFATSAAKSIGWGLTKVGLRRIGTRIGPWVAAAEQGYVSGADAIFKGAVKGVLAPVKGFYWLTEKGARALGVRGLVEWGIPKTYTTMARNFARDSYMKFSSVLQRTYPEVRNMKGLTAKDAIDAGTNAIDQALARPMEGWDAAVRAGAPMLEFDYINEAASRNLVKGIVEDVTFDTNSLARLNNEVLNMFSGQGERITAGNMISQLGQEATEDMVEKLSAKLIAFRQKTAGTAKAALKGDSATDVLMGMFNRLENIRYSNLQSPLTKFMNQAGRAASWHSRVADRILYSSQLVALERRVVMPMARWNLLFANFGPYNFLENMQRSFLGGAELLYPKSYSGVAETNRLFKGLTNAPYELVLFERGERHLAQAMIDPATGKVAVFQGGKVPFVTRNVTIPEKIPFLGGKKVGAKINIAGREYMMGSFQDGYDMWSHFNSMQVAYDFQVNYMKALAEVDPKGMGSIVNAVKGKSAQIDNIAAIHPSDARDIERVLIQEGTVGPEGIRALADIDVLEFERRQISKDFWKTADKMTDVRMTTKTTTQDAILDGSIFKDIDGFMAARVAEERDLSLISLKNQIEALTKEADAFLASPPRNLDEFLGDMQNITSMVEGTGERIHDYRKLTELRKAKLSPGEMDDFEVGSAKLLAEFMETAEADLTRIMSQLTDNASTAGLTDVQIARLTDIDSVSRLELENILATRNKIAEIEAVIPRTPKKARNERFWQQQRSQKAIIWDGYDTNARKFKGLRLRASRSFLQSVDKPVFTPEFVPDVVTELTPNHLAYLFGATGDDLYRGLTRVQHHITVRPKEDFILHTLEQADAYATKLGKTATDIGFTDEAIGDVYDQLWHNLGVESTILTPDSPTVMQLEEIRQEVTRLHAANKIPESDVVKYRQYINSVADDVEKLPMYKEAAGTPEWFATKESAMTKARDLHALSYPTYDDANIIDESMRAIFPFWNYELFRWRWIPRTYMRTPGTMTGLAKYVENTDQGYLPIPGTDLQINILRGSVWMGGLRSFYLRDFPEYYDAMPGMEFIDYIGRAGFFPGVHVMAPIVLFGAVTGKPELGQLAPNWMKTTLSTLRALSPQHIGAVLEHIYPDRFRDYMTMLTLGAEGYDADEIWRKKQNKEVLTPEEEKLWLDATNKVDGVKGILMQQTGLFRIRPPEFTEMRREFRLAIEEATGVPVSVQDQIDRQYPVTGKRFSDYYSLDILQQKLLYEWESYRRWQGVTTPLYPSSWQQLDVKIRDYYEEIERVYDVSRRTGLYEDGELIRPSMEEMNRQWVEGTIGPDQWTSFRSDMQGSLSEAIRILGESPAYKDVPKTFEERAKMLEERGITTPTQTPDQELLYYYYELRPEFKFNWESQRMERDFDTYYAYIDILLESLDVPHRERLLQRIQSDWTPMEKLYWQFSREYARPYRNIRSIVLREYQPEEIQTIRRYEVARGAERDQIREVTGPDGEKLISGFQRRVREARQRFRILDPETDAWLTFFGTTDKIMTTQAAEIHKELEKKYLVKAMIK